MDKGKLYLIPNVIADGTQQNVIPAHVKIALGTIKHFLAEDIRTARRYLSSLKLFDSIETLDFQLFNKETKIDQLSELFAPVFGGFPMGVISDAGCPGVADPGALAVMFAHENNIQVVPLVGPSSILLALMASGLNGQHFSFHGYLPIEAKECAKSIHDFERESRQKNQTQIFIETPYRSNHLKTVLLKNLSNEAWLCIAEDLTGPNEMIRTYPVKKWKTIDYDVPKVPAVFLFLSF
jgi:16S rRNA (cytidine1402-2'-O)-methyltransferase